MELQVRPKSHTIHSLLEAGWSPETTSTQAESLVDRNREVLRSVFVVTLKTAGISADKVHGDYQDWIVEDAPTVNELHGFWRIKLLSRILTSAENWQSEIDHLFFGLSLGFDIAVSEQCSMNVTASPDFGETLWIIEAVRKITKAMDYYNEALTKIMPATLRMNDYTNTISQMQGRVVVNLGRLGAARTAIEAKHWAGFTIAFVFEAINADWNSIQARSTGGTAQDLQYFIISGLEKLEPTCQGAVIFDQFLEDGSPPTVSSATGLVLG
ncbi:Fc.00g014370.m01.CDS01 [Cosmosporella sp. VM-42]